MHLTIIFFDQVERRSATCLHVCGAHSCLIIPTKVNLSTFHCYAAAAATHIKSVPKTSWKNQMGSNWPLKRHWNDRCLLHCLQRQVTQPLSQSRSKQYKAGLLWQATFLTLQVCLEIASPFFWQQITAPLSTPQWKYNLLPVQLLSAASTDATLTSIWKIFGTVMNITTQPVYWRMMWSKLEAVNIDLWSYNSDCGICPCLTSFWRFSSLIPTQSMDHYNGCWAIYEYQCMANHSWWRCTTATISAYPQL